MYTLDPVRHDVMLAAAKRLATLERHSILGDDGINWTFADQEAPFPDRPYRCAAHKVVDFGTKRGYCKVCDVDLFMDANGFFREQRDGDA